MKNQSERSIKLTALGHNQQQLENARMAEFVFSPTTEEAMGFVASLTDLTLEHEAKAHPRKRKRRAEDLLSFKAGVSAFSADLIHHSQFAEAAGFMYRSSDKDLLSQTLVSSRSFEQLTTFWPEMGLMEKTSFFRAQETWDGEPIPVFHARARRFRATPALLQLAQSAGLLGCPIKDHFTKEMSRIIPVKVRSEIVGQDGRKLKSQNLRVSGKRLDEEVRRVSEINAILAKSGFDLADNPWLYRLFNRGNYPDFDFNMCGRLYCRSDDNWQQMPKAQRSKITWKGEPTVELDVRASHLFILYALNNLELCSEPDPYFLPSVERDVVKGVFATTTGKGTFPKKWPGDFSNDYLKKTGRKISKVYKLKEVVGALQEKHPILHEISAGKLDWAKLQYEESECFMDCLGRLGREHGIAALPIYDGLIVAERHKKLATLVLQEAYHQRLGFAPAIREK